MRKLPSNKERIVIASIAMAGILSLSWALSGCGTQKFVEPFKDAPRSGVTNEQPADTITMPDGFSNMATKCDHGNRVYVAYHADSPYASIFVVKDDASCKQ